MHCLARRNNTVWVNVYFLALFVHFVTGQLVNSTASQINTAPNVSLVDPSQTYEVTDKNETREQTLSTTDILNNGSPSSTPELNISSSTLHLYNSTTDSSHVTPTLNKTGSSEQDDGTHPSVNLAIIPALAILLFLIIFCLRCCKCFRAYTRGEDKEEGNQYATILTAGDDEYGPVDVTSDTTSTANYDTVSSYCSFLKRSINDTPVKFIRADSLRFSTTKGDNYNKIPRLTDSSKSERKMVYAYKPLQSPSAASDRSEVFSRGCIRNQSVSSGELESPSDSVTFCHEGVQVKRFPKSRVSFKDCSSEESGKQRTVNTSTSELPSRLEDSALHRTLPKRVRVTNQIKFNSYNGSRHQSPEKTLPDKDSVLCLPSTSDTVIIARNDQNKPAMVCVGVQTDKSYRYSLYKRRRPFSDPGYREFSYFDTVNEEDTDGLFESTHGKCSKGKGSIKSNANNNVKRSKNSNSVTKHSGSVESKDEILSEENIASSLSLSESEDSYDDVFVQSEEPSIAEQDGSVDLDTRTSDIDCTTTNDSSSSQNSRSNNKDIDLYPSGQNGITTSCSLCQLSHPHVLTSISKCIDNMSNSFSDCTLSDSVDNDKTSHKTFLHHCDNLYICDLCLANFSKQKNGVVNTVKDRGNTENIVTSHDGDDIIITRKLSSKDLTSSMTSLESSGYAEISSESSS